ncbi:unnamed protein product [Hapterophycus canaliculatus]
MAPEMVTGKQRQSTGMDWWALGVMLFEVTLGTLPFHSELPSQSSNEIFRSIVNAELRFPRRHNLSHSAVDFIRQLLRKVRAKEAERVHGGRESDLMRGERWTRVQGRCKHPSNKQFDENVDVGSRCDEFHALGRFLCPRARLFPRLSSLAPRNMRGIQALVDPFVRRLDIMWREL